MNLTKKVDVFLLIGGEKFTSIFAHAIRLAQIVDFSSLKWYSPFTIYAAYVFCAPRRIDTITAG